MKKHTYHPLLIAGGILLGTAHGPAAEPVGAGARLFVTKAYPAHGNLQENDFRQLADAGFTVAVSKWNGPDTLPAYCRAAAAAGLDVMQWSGGMAKADTLPPSIKGDLPITPGADQVVTRVGKATLYKRPHSPAGWRQVTDRLLVLARLSLEHTNFKGVAYDFEIYGPHKTDGFCESYDDTTFTEFLHSLQKAVPDPLPPPAQRWSYLKDLGLLGMYVEYQARLTAEQVGRLRRELDAINPEFQVGVYGWGALLAPVKAHVATARAPVLDLNAATYGRTAFSRAFRGGYDADEPDRTGLKWSLITNASLARETRSRPYPAVLLGGHYPQAPGPNQGGQQYLFAARQAFHSAAYADGYWIWTDWDTPKPWTSKQDWIDAMMAEFQQANAALDAGDFTWANCRPIQNRDPGTTAPMVIVTTDGTNAAAWDPITGTRLTDAVDTNAPTAPAMLGDTPLRVNGRMVETAAPGTETPPIRFPVGHGTRGIAVGDVDGIAGPELVTLNAGWIKIWDPETAVQLLRFRVGNDQKSLHLQAP